MNNNIETFLNVLEPEDTSTGGGSASAIAGAMAGALLSMCCQLSTKEAGEYEDALRKTAILAKELSSQLLEGGTQDTLAFQAVRSAYQLSKETEVDRETRRQAIQAAWYQAARVPLDNAARCLQVARLAADLAGQINPRVHSDLSCAMLLARTGALGCLENVEINLPSLKDATIISNLKELANSLRAQLAALDTNDNPASPT